MLSASEDGTAKLWGTDGPECLMTLVHSGGIRTARFDYQGDVLCTAGADATVRLWDMKKIEPRIVERSSDRYLESIGLDGHTDAITCLDFNQDGVCFATGSEDNTIKFWRYHWEGERLTAECFNTIGGHRTKVWGVKFSPDGERLVSCGDGTNLHVWWGAGPTHMTNLVGHTMPSRAVGFLPNQWILSGCEDGKTRMWYNQQLDVLAEDVQRLQTCMQTYNDESSKLIINSFIYEPLPLAQKIKYVATR